MPQPAQGADPTASEWFRTQYIEGVIDIFQNKGGRLLNTVRRKTNLASADEAKFHVYGKVEAKKKTGGQVPVSHAPKSFVLVTTDKYYAATTIEQYDLDRMAPDDVDAAKRAGGFALARKADEIIMDALKLSAVTPISGTSFFSPVYNDLITEEFESKDIYDDEEIIVLLSPRAWSQVRRFDEFANADYVGPDIPWIRKQHMRTWGGKTYIRVPQSYLDKTGNNRTCFAYAPSAVGHASLGDLTTIMTWENRFDHWFNNMNMSQGAKIILPEGVLPFTVDESISPEAIDPDTYATA